MARKNDWFTIDRVDDGTFVISEHRHWEETHCYLLVGSHRALLIDTGLGVCDISAEVCRLTDKPVSAVSTHVHWDHIGGHKYFPDVYAHEAERNWLDGKFPLPVYAVRNMVADCCELPDGFDINAYEIFQGIPTCMLEDGDNIDLGGRIVQALHTPGHSPGHLCFWEPERGYLFAGDLIYKGTLYANYPSTDPERYLASLEKIAALPIQKLFPGHHSLDIHPEIAARMRDAFREMNAAGKLHHGSGTYNFGDWAVCL